MKKTLFLGLVLISASVHAQRKGQARVDSLLQVLRSTMQDSNRVKSLNALATEFLDAGKPDSALALSSSALLLAKKINYLPGEGGSLLSLGEVYASKANTTAALKNYEAAASAFEKAGVVRGRAEAYHSMGVLHQRTNYDEAIRLFQRELRAAEELGDANLSGRAASIIAVTLLRKGEYNEAARYNDIGISYYTKAKNERGLANCYVASARINYRRGNLQQSLKDNYSALRLFEQTGNKTGLYNVYTGLGLIYEDQKNYPEAVNSYLASRKSAEEIGDNETLANANNNLGNAYRELGKTEEAREVFEESLRLAELARSKKAIANARGNLGTIYSLTGRPQQALNNYEEAIKVYEELGAKELVGIGFLEMAKVYINERKPAESKAWAEKALHIARQVQNKDVMSRTYLLLTRIDTTMGNYASAYNNYNHYVTYRDSVANAEATRHLIEERMQYAFSKKEDSLRLQQALIAEKLDKQTLLTKQQQQELKLQEASLFLAQREKDVQLLSFLKTKAELQLDKEQQEKQLALANQERTLQKTRLEKETLLSKQKEQELLLKDRELTVQRAQRNFWLSGAIALFVLSLFVFRTYRNQRKANLLLQQQQARTEQALKELKAAQTQLIQSEKMASLGELTAGIAHEIQNPLNFVNNFSEVNDEMLEEMKEELATGNIEAALLLAEGLKENNVKVHHHGKRADAIVKGMLQHSRAGSRRMEPVDINTLADEYLRLSFHGLRAQDKDFNSDFSTHFDSGIGKIEAVPQDIGRVLLNLYNNAFYAVNERKKQAGADFKPMVSVTTRKREDGIDIVVRDNGTGIPQKALEKIYQPFFTTKPTGQGTGLGLSLSYDIIKAYGGELKVETREGDFTEFIVRLPLLENVNADASSTTEPGAVTSSAGVPS